MKVKICPVCGTENPDTPANCSNCNYDLFFVEPVDKKEDPPASAPQPAPVQPAQDAPVRSGRLCRKCNQIKPISMFTCDVCGSNLSSAPIMSSADLPRNSAIPFGAAAPAAAVATWELCAPDGRVLLQIRDGEEKLIGWEHELASYLDESFAFVGRAHAYISVLQGNAFIADNQSKNGVQVNRQNISVGQKYALQNGDQISLGDRMLNQDRRAAHFTIKKRAGGNGQ